ncbi:FadR/GntR family transcriptional regulator [Propionibacterium sp.]|uniref:FadR/GntR family transcriptional regulator n=1 Tax=Propionibacterium sp. TaxID=1977903 RepID=UPI0039E8B274
MAQSRVEATVNELLASVVNGGVKPGESLPAEAALAQSLDVSRLTLREAVRILTDRGVLRPVHGSGTFVNPPEQWTDLGSMIALQAQTSGPREIALDLVEIRRMIEVAASGLAAERRTDKDLSVMEMSLAQFRTGHGEDDVAATVRSDLTFHDAILRAAGNPFLPTVFDPLREALLAGRAETSAHSEVRVHAMAHHEAILVAIRDRDVEAAQSTMAAHMDQTAADITAHVPAR